MTAGAMAGRGWSWAPGLVKALSEGGPNVLFALLAAALVAVVWDSGREDRRMMRDAFQGLSSTIAETCGPGR